MKHTKLYEQIKKRSLARMQLPVWVVLLLITFLSIGVAFVVHNIVDTESERAVRLYQDEQIIRTSSTTALEQYFYKALLYNSGQMSKFIILSLTLGVTFGVGRGIALVRVH